MSAGREVEHLDRPVILGRHEQLVLADVGEQMVDVPVVAGKVAAVHEHQWLAARRRERQRGGQRAGQGEAGENQSTPEVHSLLPS